MYNNLDVGANNIGDEGAISIITGWTKNNTLITLNLRKSFMRYR